MPWLIGRTGNGLVWYGGMSFCVAPTTNSEAAVDAYEAAKMSGVRLSIPLEISFAPH